MGWNTKLDNKESIKEEVEKYNIKKKYYGLRTGNYERKLGLTKKLNFFILYFFGTKILLQISFDRVSHNALT